MGGFAREGVGGVGGHTAPFPLKLSIQ